MVITVHPVVIDPSTSVVHVHTTTYYGQTYMQVTNEKQKPPWKIPSRSQILFCPPIQLSKDILLLFPFLEPKPNNSSNSSSSTVSSRILSSSFSFSPYPTGLHHSPSPRKRFGSLVGLLTCDLLSYRRVPFSSPSSYSVYSFLSSFFFPKLIFN